MTFFTESLYSSSTEFQGRDANVEKDPRVFLRGIDRYLYLGYRHLYGSDDADT